MGGRDTKAALTEAMAELLWERGYAGTSPTMVLKRSNVGQGSMYHYFSGKAELAATAIRAMSDDLRARVDVALASRDSAIERVEAYLDSEREPLAGCRLGRLVQDADVVADAQLREPVADYLAWTRTRLTEVLDDGVRSGELRADTDVPGLVSLVTAAVQGAYVLSRALGDPDAFRQTMDGVRHALEAARVR